MSKLDFERLHTDVLVVGGGVAGSLAALACREQGLDVVVCDKAGSIDWAGSVGGGVDQFLTVMETGPEWDSPDYFIRRLPELTDGVVDLAVSAAVIREMPRMLRRLEGLGVDFRDPVTGQYERHNSFGLPGTYHLDFNGRKFKQTIGRAARRAGARPLVRTAVTDLFVSGGEVQGALALHFRTGAWTLIEAPAVILTTGDINRLSRNASGMPFDSWHLPYNTGDGQAIGYRAGAALANMEFVEATLTPRGFSAQGTNAFTGLGAHYLNRHGERFMLRYDPRAEKARRSVLVDAVIAELLAGNGPIYLDLTHLPRVEIDNLERTMGIDRYTLPSYFRQRGLNLHKEPIEITVSEFSIRRSGLYFRGSGLAIDTDGQTNVAGLYAAGDCSSVSGGIAGAATTGHLAGVALRRVLKPGAGSRPVADDAVRQVLEDRVRPLEREEGPRYHEVEDTLRDVVTRDVGFRRTRSSLGRAIEALRELETDEASMRAVNTHDLMRSRETASIRLSAELMAVAARERTESRTGSSHRRLDFPEQDDSRWNQFVVLEKGGDGPRISTVSADRPLSSHWRSDSRVAQGAAS